LLLLALLTVAASAIDGQRASTLLAEQTPDKSAQQQQQQHTVPPSAISAIVAGLSSPAGDRFSVDLRITSSALHLAPQAAVAAGPVSSAAAAAAAGGCTASSGVTVRVRLGLSWLPGLPSQVLQAVQEVLSQQRYLQLLGACLLQPGANYLALSLLGLWFLNYHSPGLMYMAHAKP
jgi:hypothetical protein